jgi:hypothetical protein
VKYLVIVIFKERLSGSRKFKLCDHKILLAHFKKHKINCIFLYTFMKQLKPVRDDEKVRKSVRRKKKIKYLETAKNLSKFFFSPSKKIHGILKCLKFQSHQHLFDYIF